MTKPKFKSGDRVQFNAFDDQCRPCVVTGIVRQYLSTHSFHPDGYIEVVDEAGELILYGNAADIRPAPKRYSAPPDGPGCPCPIT